MCKSAYVWDVSETSVRKQTGWSLGFVGGWYPNQERQGITQSPQGWRGSLFRIFWVCFRSVLLLPWNIFDLFSSLQDFLDFFGMFPVTLIPSFKHIWPVYLSSGFFGFVWYVSGQSCSFLQTYMACLSLFRIFYFFQVELIPLFKHLCSLYPLWAFHSELM
jgi:hypothetical protein